jgi:hypothetical protein
VEKGWRERVHLGSRKQRQKRPETEAQEQMNFVTLKKKDGKYRLVNHTAELNKYTIRDANMPLNINIFLEKFAGCAVTSLIDFFSGYDHVKLDSKCRDMTVFIISLGLLK